MTKIDVYDPDTGFWIPCWQNFLKSLDPKDQWEIDDMVTYSISKYGGYIDFSTGRDGVTRFNVIFDNDDDATVFILRWA